MGLFSKGGFADNLWSTAKKRISNTFKTSIKSNALDGLINAINRGSGGLLSGLVDISTYSHYQDYLGGANRSFTSNYTKTARTGYDDIFDTTIYNENLLKANKLNVVINGDYFDKSDKEVDELKNKMYIPEYGYDMFLNERTIFQKGIHNFFGAPSYFYFKIFFKFDTSYGLFGDILNRTSYGHGSAGRYLVSLYNSSTIANNRFLALERLSALSKFVKTLSYINCTAPWFFRSVKGLDKANSITQTDFTKDKSISIECSQESIDMRLNTLFDLYKFVCYDDINNKEILPDNLRKFDMAIMIFQSPIKKIHSSLSQGDNVILDMPNTNFNENNFMGFKLFEFMGCEFDVNSLGNMMPGDINNEMPFELGKGNINIKYNKCVRLNSNEFNGILFGDYGLFYDYDTANKKRLYNSMVGPNAKRIDSLTHKYSSGNKIIDFNEQYTVNNLMKLSRFTMGNIFGEDRALRFYKDDYKSENNTLTSNDLTNTGTYAVLRHTDKKTTLESLANIGLGIIENWLKRPNTGKDKFLDDNDGSINGYRLAVVGGDLWKLQMQKLTSKYPHVYTQMPSNVKYNKSWEKVSTDLQTYYDNRDSMLNKSLYNNNLAKTAENILRKWTPNDNDVLKTKHYENGDLGMLESESYNNHQYTNKPFYK